MTFDEFLEDVDEDAMQKKLNKMMDENLRPLLQRIDAAKKNKRDMKRDDLTHDEWYQLCEFLGKAATLAIKRSKDSETMTQAAENMLCVVLMKTLGPDKPMYLSRKEAVELTRDYEIVNAVDSRGMMSIRAALKQPETEQRRPGGLEEDDGAAHA